MRVEQQLELVSVSHPFNFKDISMVFVFSGKNRAPPVVLRGEQQLDHGFC